jgi:hypothetical protein
MDEGERCSRGYAVRGIGFSDKKGSGMLEPSFRFSPRDLFFVKRQRGNDLFYIWYDRLSQVFQGSL